MICAVVVASSVAVGMLAGVVALVASGKMSVFAGTPAALVAACLCWMCGRSWVSVCGGTVLTVESEAIRIETRTLQHPIVMPILGVSGYDVPPVPYRYEQRPKRHSGIAVLGAPGRSRLCLTLEVVSPIAVPWRRGLQRGDAAPRVIVLLGDAADRIRLRQTLERACRYACETRPAPSQGTFSQRRPIASASPRDPSDLNPAEHGAQGLRHQVLETVILRDEHREDGNERHLRARIKDDGSLEIEGQDFGPATSMVSPDGEYEWWETIAPQYLPQLVALLGGEPGEPILDLLVNRYTGDRSYDFEARLRAATFPIELAVWS